MRKKVKDLPPHTHTLFKIAYQGLWNNLARMFVDQVCILRNYLIFRTRPQWRIRGVDPPGTVFLACQFENSYGLAFWRTVTPPPPL